MSALRKLAQIEAEMREQFATYTERQAEAQAAMEAQPAHMRGFYANEIAKMQGRLEELDHLLRVLESL